MPDSAARAGPGAEPPQSRKVVFAANAGIAVSKFIVAAVTGSSAMLASAIEVPIVQQTFRRYSPQRLARSFSHHRELIDALMAHDSAWAKAVMSSHSHSAKQTLLGAQNT